jgi:hypothetical protein
VIIGGEIDCSHEAMSVLIISLNEGLFNFRDFGRSHNVERVQNISFGAF